LRGRVFPGKMLPFFMKWQMFFSLTAWLIAGWSPLRAETSHNFAKWEKDIAAFEKADKVSPPPKNALLFVGSSTIRLWTTLAQDFPGYPVLNRGFGGSEIADVTHFADRIIFPYEPSVIYLRSGTNDLHAGKKAAQVFADLQAFVEAVHAKMPDVDIVYISLSPSIARWNEAPQTKELNALVEQYTKTTPHVKYLDAYGVSLGPDGQPRPELFRADKLHFNAEGYKLLAERVRLALPPQAAP